MRVIHRAIVITSHQTANFVVATYVAAEIRVAHKAIIVSRQTPSILAPATHAAAATRAAHGAGSCSYQNANTIPASHIGIHHLEILDDPSLKNSTEKPHTIFARAVDKQVSYLIPLPVESPRKPVIRSSNWLPALSTIGCQARQFRVTGSGRIEVVYQDEVAVQVITDIMKLVPIRNLIGISLCPTPSREWSEVSHDGVVAIHGDGGCGIINIGNGAHIARPVDKAVASTWSGHQVDHCSLVIGRSPFSRGGYRPAIGAGDGEVIYCHKVGCDGVVSIHGDGGCGIINIGNGAHIARPVDKAVASTWSGHQVDHCSLVIGGSPFSRGGNPTTRSTGNSEGIRFTTITTTITITITVTTTTYDPCN